MSEQSRGDASRMNVKPSGLDVRGQVVMGMDLQCTIRELIAAGEIPKALVALRSGWDHYLRDNGAARARELCSEFDTFDLLRSVETASIVWLLNAVPPELEPLGPFATRILTAREEDIRVLGVRDRTTVMTATMLVWMSRGRLDRASLTAQRSLDDLGRAGHLSPTTIGPVYAEFLLAIARVKLFGGALRESVELFNEVLAYSEVAGAAVTTYRALVGQAIAFALNAEFGVAQDLISSAKDIGPDAEYDWNRQAVELTWCQTLIWAYQGQNIELNAAAQRVSARASVEPEWRELARILEARVLLSEGRDLEAANILKNLLQSVAVSNEFPLLEDSATFLLGLALIKADQPNAALRAIDKAPATTMHMSGLVAVRAFALIGRGQPDAAIEVTDACLELGREHPGLLLVYVHGARAVAFELLGLHSSAEYSMSAGFSLAVSAGIHMERDIFAGPELEYLWQRVESKRRSECEERSSAGSRSDTGARLAQLTPKEREVLRRLARPGTLADVAADLFITENTVKTHAKSIYRKLSIRSRAEASDLVNAAGH
jgi:DNA-binding CsgD family transcriptional regulator